MKRLFTVSLATLALFCLATPSFGQRLSAGPKVGVNFSTWSGDIEDVDTKTGFNVGAVFGIDLSEYFRLQIEGQYVQKGVKDSEQGLTAKIKVDYIEFLFPATLTIPTGSGAVTPRFFAGPSLAFEMNCTVTAEYQGSDDSASCSDGGLESKSVDFGLLIGAGLDVATGNSGAVFLDILYNLGLVNINDTPGGEDVSVKNRNIQIDAGYKFFFGG